MDKKIKILVCPEDKENDSLRGRSEKISRDFDLPLYLGDIKQLDPRTDFLIMVSKSAGIYLKPVNDMITRLGSNAVYPDWLGMDTSSAAGRKTSQPLIKAVRGRKNSLKNGVVLDCTAGWGEDSWIMASFGFHLISLERNRVVYLLLRDAYARAGTRFPQICTRMKLLNKEARELMRILASEKWGVNGKSLISTPDVVYLDPMFPHYDKRKTAEKKASRVLRMLQDEFAVDEWKEYELLDLALQVARNKVVVKRPQKGTFYAGGSIMPVHQVWGKAVRFDVYTPSTRG